MLQCYNNVVLLMEKHTLRVRIKKEEGGEEGRKKKKKGSPSHYGVGPHLSFLSVAATDGKM